MLRISLRHLIYLVTAVALAVVSLRNSSLFWLGIISTYSALAWLGFSVYAVLDRGPRQAFAIGFTLLSLTYGLLIYRFGECDFTRKVENIELADSLGKFPTTKLLHRLRLALSHPYYYNRVTGEVAPPDRIKEYLAAERAAQTGRQPFRHEYVAARNEPSEETFTPIGQCWWGVLFGCLGGVVARLGYCLWMRSKAGALLE